jgi:hypothetical protein
MKDQIKFKEYMATLCEIHDKTMSSILIDLYWKVLEPFTDEQCEKAFQEVIISSRFFPKPVDMIELIHGKRDHESTRAWLSAYDAICRVGNYSSVKFRDPVIHSVIGSMGGWPTFCSMTTDEAKWKQKEFERIYQVISEREGRHPEYLPGTTELVNSANGFNVKHEIVNIGFNELKMIA